ncbi:uncharacterized protein ACRADG_012846 [Cochliomyia hominivorax]
MFQSALNFCRQVYANALSCSVLHTKTSDGIFFSLHWNRGDALRSRWFTCEYKEDNYLKLTKTSLRTVAHNPHKQTDIIPVKKQRNAGKTNKLQDLLKQTSLDDDALRTKSSQQQLVAINSILSAIDKQPGKPYATNIEEPQKIIFSDHNFYYKYKTEKYNIFHCCYDNGKSKCPAKVVTYNYLGYYIDDKHSHKIETKNKNVTTNHIKIEDPSVRKTDFNLNDNNSVKDFKKIHIKEEKCTQDEFLEITDAIPDKVNVIEDPKEFREKIKKRLEKRLSRKVKKLNSS